MRASLHLRQHPRKQAPTSKTERNKVDHWPIWLGWRKRILWFRWQQTSEKSICALILEYRRIFDLYQGTPLVLENWTSPESQRIHRSLFHLEVGKINSLWLIRGCRSAEVNFKLSPRDVPMTLRRVRSTPDPSREIYPWVSQGRLTSILAPGCWEIARDGRIEKLAS